MTQPLDSKHVFQSFCNKKFSIIRKKCLKSGRDFSSRSTMTGSSVTEPGKAWVGQANSEGRGRPCRGTQRSSKCLEVPRFLSRWTSRTQTFRLSWVHGRHLKHCQYTGKLLICWRLLHTQVQAATSPGAQNCQVSSPVTTSHSLSEWVGCPNTTGNFEP